MTDSFWTGGPKAYTDGITSEHEAKLAKLHAALADCEDQDSKRCIEQEIATAKTEFKKKLNGSDSLIF